MITTERKFIPAYSYRHYSGDEGHDAISTFTTSIEVFDRPLYKKGNEISEFVVTCGLGGGYALWQRGDTWDTKNKMFFDAEFSNGDELSKYMKTLDDTFNDNGFVKVMDFSGTLEC